MPGIFRRWCTTASSTACSKRTARDSRFSKQSQFDYDLEQLAELWQHGSVVRSWLLELLVLRVPRGSGPRKTSRGYVDDTGEGRWTVEAAIDENVPAPVITLSLLARMASRQDESFSAKVVAALRNQFGGHAVKSETHA